MTFSGYERPDGTIGCRNYVLVIPGGLVATKICDFVEGTKTLIVPSDTYSDHTARDRETIGRTFIGLGKNPNVASVIVIGSSSAGEHSEFVFTRVAEEIGKTGKRVEVLDVDKEGGTLQSIVQGIRVARDMVHQASRLTRRSFGIDHLTVAVKCGSSDTMSGLAGNPVIGNLFDRIVTAGGTAIFGENTEIVGAEQILSRRGVNEEVSRRIIDVAAELEARALATGEDIRTMNPTPGNIEGGISTLEEKSLGAICKSGTAPIQGVLAYSERPKGKGLYFCDNNPQASIFTGYSASGAQILFYQFGGGGYGGNLGGQYEGILGTSPGMVAPLFWTTASPRTFAAFQNSIDFYSGTVLEGNDNVESAGEKLLQLVIEVASGALTKVETVRHTDPTEFYFKDFKF